MANDGVIIFRGAGPRRPATGPDDYFFSDDGFLDAALLPFFGLALAFFLSLPCALLPFAMTWNLGLG